MAESWFPRDEEPREEGMGDLPQEEEGGFLPFDPEAPEGEGAELPPTDVYEDTDVEAEDTEDVLEEEAAPGNRMFIFAVVGLVLFMLAALCLMGTYALVLRPRQQAAQKTQVAAITQTAAQQAVLAAGMTATAQVAEQLTATAQAAAALTATAEAQAALTATAQAEAAQAATATAQAAAATPEAATPAPTEAAPEAGEPTPTPVVVLQNQTPTPTLDLAALQAAATQTAQALAQAEHTQLPQTGFGTEGGGNMWLWAGLAVVLLAFILLVRRLRAAV